MNNKLRIAKRVLLVLISGICLILVYLELPHFLPRSTNRYGSLIAGANQRCVNINSPVNG